MENLFSSYSVLSGINPNLQTNSESMTKAQLGLAIIAAKQAENVKFIVGRAMFLLNLSILRAA